MNRAAFKENLSKCKMCKRQCSCWMAVGGEEHVLKETYYKIQRVCSKIKMCSKNMEATTQVISFMIPPRHCVSARSPVLVPAL